MIQTPAWALFFGNVFVKQDVGLGIAQQARQRDLAVEASPSCSIRSKA
jgi:hypothetical protein